ncbi:MAG: TolC family protein, partial [Planctomycetota bacterium]
RESAPSVRREPPPVAEPPQGSNASPVSLDALTKHIPDPERERADLMAELSTLDPKKDPARYKYIQRVLERIRTIRRKQQVHLSLEEVIRRTLANNYGIEVVRYNPAVDLTRVVEAEAAFDAVFFTNVTKNNVDRPTGSQLLSTDLDVLDLSSGVRKLLPVGTQVSGTYELTRTKQTFAFQLINPEYFSRLILEMRQPLLRGFGLDVNRSLIVLAQHDRKISRLTFERQVRDTLRQVEELYWRLVQARREVVINARLLAEFEAIYEYLVARGGYDVTPVQIEATRADLEEAKATFVQQEAEVFNAEDRLLGMINDPSLNLVDHPELIPDDFPQLAQIEVDPLAEVQTALDHRTELKEQELRIASAKINVGRAKNAELPRFDLTFRVTYDGLSGTADRSFDELSRTKFIEYFIGVEFEMPIGNRGPRAARRRAQLQHAQAVAELKRLFEQVITEVNLAVRGLNVAYDQIAPSYESAQARLREVESIVARAERKDFNTLINELGARQRLANIRSAMLRAMVDYNVAIIELERAKGTLLEHDNVVVAGPDEPVRSDTP